MIYYSTGTGNSRWVAEQLGALLGEGLTAIDHRLLSRPDLSIDTAEGERLILVGPVHSWGPALMNMRLVRQARFGAREAWAVMVCGDNCGNADQTLAKALRRKGVELRGTYSVQMPNNYILMKGFGIDPEELQRSKIAAAPARISAIADAIKSGRAAGDDLYVRGTKPWVKTSLVYPLFATMMVKQVKFGADATRCTHCGLCAQVCPTGNISLADGLPQWGRDCTQCSACIHHCPARAIDYGRVSQNEGRYVFRASAADDKE